MEENKKVEVSENKETLVKKPRAPRKKKVVEATPSQETKTDSSLEAPTGIKKTNSNKNSDTKNIKKIDLTKKKNIESSPIKIEKSINKTADLESLNSDIYETLAKKKLNVLPQKKKLSDEELTRNKANKLLNAQRFDPEVEMGLTLEQVKQRNDEELTNKQSGKSTKSYWNIIYTNVFTLLNVLLLTIFIALMCVQKYSDGFFMIIALANTIIGIVQEIRAKQTIDKLKLVTAPTAKVVRNGEELNVPTDELVLDDIMFLSTGNQIGCDAVLVKGTVEVNESLLTGESLPIKKQPGDVVLAGSFVVSGSCVTKVDKVGELCYANSLQQKAKKYTKPKSELFKSMNLILKVVTFLIIPIGVVLFILNYTASTSPDIWGMSGKVASAISSTAGSLIGMIPSGLMLLTSMALATGVLRLSQSKTLVQELYCIEMLARVNCLCLDKTGTLTDGTMKVAEVVIFDNSRDISSLMGSYLSCFEDANQTSIALSAVYPLNTDFRHIAKIPFSSQRKFSAVSFKDNGTFMLGAPEYVYKGKDEETKRLISSRVKKGYRVVMLCHSDSYIEDGTFSGTAKPVALFILIDHIRKEAPATIKWFNENGVQIKIISGDNPYTAANIAKHCGVIDSDKCISLEGVSLQETKALATQYTVFGRVSPEQKAALIQALKQSGKTVAMTGDGVNDILAMKHSDCSIAMASGAEAPRNVAHLVLLDSNFASMPKVVEEGRRVINNIQRSSALFLMKTIFTFCLTLGIIFMNLFGSQVQYPLQPSNLMIMEFFGIGVPSFFLALQPNNNLIKGNFMKNTLLRAIPGSITMLIVMIVVSSLNIGNFFEFAEVGSTSAQVAITTMQVMGLIITALTMVYLLSRPLNLYRTILLIGVIAFSTLAAFILPSNIIGIDYTTLTKTSCIFLVIMIFGLPFICYALDYFFSLFRDDVDRVAKVNSEAKRPFISFKRKEKKAEAVAHNSEEVTSKNTTNEKAK